MIEFTGILSGSAKKRFLKRVANYGQKYLVIGELFVLPIIILIAVKMENWIPIGAYLGYSILILLLPRIPKSKKEVDAIIPKKVYIEDGSIICVAEKYVEYRNLADVKRIHDFGEYYELRFSFGKISEKFICQKNLITKGTLEEFENLFRDKIIRT